MTEDEVVGMLRGVYDEFLVLQDDPKYYWVFDDLSTDIGNLIDDVQSGANG